MKFLPSPETKAAAPSAAPPLHRKGAAEAFHVPLSRVGRPYKSSWDVNRAVREGMERVTWVFRAVHAISDNAARLRAVNREGDRFAGIETDSVLARLLSQYPNPHEPAYHFRYRLSSTVLLSKAGAFVEIVGDPQDPEALYLLPPGRVAPIPDPTRFVAGYEVDFGGGEKKVLDPETVVWVRWPHPTDAYGSLTPLEAAGLAMDVDYLARIYNRTFLQNDGRPGGIVGVRGEMDDDVHQELTDRWNVGTAGAGRISVVEADGLDFVDTAVSPRDAQHVENRKASKEEILGAFGVPESVALANASERTYSNADQEWINFWTSTMLGHLTMIASPFDRLDQEAETFLGFDLSSVDALARLALEERKVALEEWKAGARTLDSLLEARGDDPTNTPAGRSYWLPMGVAPQIGPDVPKSIDAWIDSRIVPEPAVIDDAGGKGPPPLPGAPDPGR